MKNNKVMIIGLLFFAGCLALIGGVYYFSTTLRGLQEEYNELAQRRTELKSETDSLMAQKSVFTQAFKELENYHVSAAPSELSFYSDVQQVVQNNGIEILSTRQQGLNKNNVSTIAMTLRGDYYSLMQVLATWRTLPMTVRVGNLTLRSDTAKGASGKPVNGFVQADVNLEALVAAQ